MKITLTRQIRLDIADVFLIVERDDLRKGKEIQDYLNGSGYDKTVNDRIKNYLKTINIYDKEIDNDFVLTKYGIFVKETGMFKVKEKGKYKIWLDDDTRIVFIHRIEPNRSHQKTDKELVLVLRGKEHFCLPTDEEGFYRFDVLSEIIYGTFTNYNDTIIETITITEEGTITEFYGQLIKSVQEKSVKENVEFVGKSLFDMVEMIFEDKWDKNTERLKVQLSSLDNNTIETFEYKEKEIDGKYLHFDVRVYDWPIEPYNGSEAIKWRNILLNKEVEKDYLTEKEFDRLVLSMNGKDEFFAYKFTLDTPKIKDYLKDEEITVPYSESFWHLYAPMDLCPDIHIPEEIIINKETFEVNLGNRSMREIVEKINVLNPDFVFCCDSYTDTYYQQRTIAVFLDACGAKTKKMLITSMRQNNKNKKKRDSYLENNRMDIKIKFLQQQQHRRCIVFHKNGDQHIWNLDDSFDFIRYDSKGPVAPTDIGRIERPVVFTKVSDNVLDPGVLNIIRQVVKIV
jgi:hypothetical protein